MSATQAIGAREKETPLDQIIDDMVDEFTGVCGPPTVHPNTVTVNVTLDQNLNARLKIECQPKYAGFKRDYSQFLHTRDYCRYQRDARYFYLRIGDYDRASYQFQQDMRNRYGCRTDFFGFPRELITCFAAPCAPQPSTAAAAPAAAAVTAGAGADPEDRRKAQIDANMRRYFAGGLYDVLKPYQRDGVSFAIQHGAKCIIGDDMGLGKTIQSVCVYKYLKEDGQLPAGHDKVLILCPSSLRVQWPREFVQWLNGYTAMAAAGAAAGANAPLDEERDFLVVFKGADFDRLTPAHRFLVTSYDLATRHAAKLAAVRWGFYIADESHMLKNKDAKRTKTLQPLLQGIARGLLLSGTPALSKPVELWSQIRTMRPDLFPSFRNYTVRYCAGHGMELWRGGRKQQVWVADGCTNAIELFIVLTKGGLMIRRRKADVLTQLPAKIRQQVLLNVPLPKHMQNQMLKARQLMEEQRRYEQERKKLLEQYAQRKRDGVERGELMAAAAAAVPGKITGAGPDESILELFSQLPSLKKGAVREYLMDFVEGLDEGHKFLLFAHHKEMMDALHDVLVKECRLGAAGVMRIDGSTLPKNRAAYVDRFQQDPRCRAALLSITAAGVGLTLTAATTVIFAELNWTPGILNQAESRAHRIGQEGTVVVKYLIGRGTIEEDIWAMVGRKIDNLSLLLDSQHTTAGMDAGVVSANGTPLVVQSAPPASSAGPAAAVAPGPGQESIVPHLKRQKRE